jgi:uncharacterized protein (TIGR03435 family)
MKLKSLLALSFAAAAALSAQCQSTEPNPNALKAGSPAPELKFTHLLQAPAGAKVDWASLHGKAVVLEFWATWCVPCVADIPVLNSLQASLDPSKVQFISIDDEDAAVVQLFLKKRTVSGWLGFENSGMLQQEYGVTDIPATIVIDPNGRIVSTTATPATLSKEQLLAVVDGKDGPLDVVHPSTAKPSLTDETKASAKEDETHTDSKTEDADLALLEIVLSKGGEGGSRNQFQGPGHFDLTNLTPVGLLRNALDIPESRISSPPELLTKKYNLHVNAPHLDQDLFNQAVETAIAAGIGVHIKHHIAETQSYVLTAKPEAKDHFSESSLGFAVYQPKIQTLTCRSASATKIAAALEQILGIPVVNETGLKGQATSSLKIVPKDLASANEALGKELGLTLVPAERPIETLSLTP